MSPGQYHRMYAGIAVDMATEATDPGWRVSLLEMAEAWQKLADKEERPQLDSASPPNAGNGKQNGWQRHAPRNQP